MHNIGKNKIANMGGTFNYINCECIGGMKKNKNIITEIRRKVLSNAEFYYDKELLKNTMTFSCIINSNISSCKLYIKPTISGIATELGDISFTNNQKASLTFNLTDEKIETLKAGSGGIFQIYKSGVDFSTLNISEVQVEEGSQATNYEPYVRW